MYQETVAVKRGAKLLDSLVPNWPRKIRKSTLELDDPSMCVLGQVWGNFHSGLRKMAEKAIHVHLKASPLKKIRTPDGNIVSDLVENATEINAEFYGFDILDTNNASYERLGQAWLREIDARRG